MARKLEVIHFQTERNREAICEANGCDVIIQLTHDHFLVYVGELENEGQRDFALVCNKHLLENFTEIELKDKSEIAQE